MNTPFLFILIFIWLIVSMVLSAKSKTSLLSFDINNVIPLRGVLALSIIAAHLNFHFNHLTIVSSFSNWGKYVVAMFFFISGYGLTCSYTKRGKKYIDGFVSNRIIKVFAPYLICIIANQIYQYYQLRRINNIFHIDKMGEFFPNLLLPTSWFVIVILGFYLLFYIVFKYINSVKKALTLLLFCTIIYFIYLKKLNWGDYWTDSIFSINLGMFFSYYEGYIRRLLTNNNRIFLIFAFLLFYILLPEVAKQYKYSLSEYYYPFLITIMPLFIVLAIYNQGFIKNRITFFLGNISYEIYLVQGLLGTILWQFTENPASYILFIFLLSILSAWVLNKFCAYLYSLYHHFCCNSIVSH